MSDQWYVLRNGEQLGPFSGSQLRQLAATGQIAPTDLIWKQGMADWKQCSAAKGLFDAVPPISLPPPLPPSFSDDRVRYGNIGQIILWYRLLMVSLLLLVLHMLLCPFIYSVFPEIIESPLSAINGIAIAVAAIGLTLFIRWPIGWLFCILCVIVCIPVPLLSAVLSAPMLMRAHGIFRAAGTPMNFLGPHRG